MRRLGRHFFTFCSALSLLLCVAVCVPWARSYRLTDQITWRCAGGWRSVRSAHGYVEVSLLLADWSDHPELFNGPKYQRDEARPPVNWLMELGGSSGDRDLSWEWRGFAWYEKRNTRRSTLY